MDRPATNADGKTLAPFMPVLEEQKVSAGAEVNDCKRCATRAFP
jgi:hypothetical protein